MTDLEMTKLCAEAMGYSGISIGADRTIDGKPFPGDPLKVFTSQTHEFDPLHDDAQAMALVKKLNLSVNRHNEGRYLNWHVGDFGYHRGVHTEHPTDLNRAIVECVAKMQDARSGTKSGEAMDSTQPQAKS